MGRYTPLVPGPSIGPSTTLSQEATDLVIVDTSIGSDPANPRALRGVHYLLPPMQLLAPVRAILFHASDHDFPLFWPMPSGNHVADLGGLRYWTLTLREPDGTYILKDWPVALLGASRWDLPANARKRTHYFDTLCLPDPRQSYLTTGGDAPKDTLAFSFIY